MKCIHCNSEWKTDEKMASSLASCPFCGKSLAENEEPPKIGDIIPFGNYKWRVLDIQGNEALIITEDIIEKRKYNEKHIEVTWETCDLRKYLNNEFLRKFTKEQQGRIVETTNRNPDNLWYGTKGGSDTRDKIFLLSLEEADRYFGDSRDYLNKRRKKDDNEKYITASDGYLLSNNYDRDRVANYRSEEAYWWWLRSSGSSSSEGSVRFGGPVVNNAARVNKGGSVAVDGNPVSGYILIMGNGGVRPALWLKV